MPRLARFLTHQLVVNQVFQCLPRHLEQFGFFCRILLLIILRDRRHVRVIRIELTQRLLNLLDLLPD